MSKGQWRKGVLAMGNEPPGKTTAVAVALSIGFSKRLTEKPLEGIEPSTYSCLVKDSLGHHRISAPWRNTKESLHH